MRKISLLALVAGLLASGHALAQSNAGVAVQATTPVAGAAVGAAAAANPNQWRYVQHNGQWWYYTPQNSWMRWNGSAWAPHTYSGYGGYGYTGAPYTAGYRGYGANGYYNGYGIGYNNGGYNNGGYNNGGYNNGYYGNGYGAGYGPNGAYGYGSQSANVGANLGGAIGGQAGANVGAAIGGGFRGGRGR
jgi:hypothetical protein